jgi:hypothetical protein
MTLRGLDDVLRDYVRAWNEPDDAERARLLRGCVTDDVKMAPGYKPEAAPIRGRDSLSAEIGAMIVGRPSEGDYRLTLIGGADRHHGWARFRWHVADRAGTTLRLGDFEVAGLDIVHVGDDGRLDTIVVFLD